MFIVGGLMMGVICAFASKTIMENKGYTDTTTYILLGFFLGIIGYHCGYQAGSECCRCTARYAGPDQHRQFKR